MSVFVFFFFSSRRRHTRLQGDWSSDVCSSDLFLLNWQQRSESAAAYRCAKPEVLSVRRKGVYYDCGEAGCGRSEERRVGKEWRSRWEREEQKKKRNKRMED